MSQDKYKEILTNYQTIAVVGLSREPNKPSYQVASYLKEHGFCIIPVNPFAEEILGEKSYKSLIDMPAEVQETIDIVDIFRPSKDALPIVEQAVQLKAKTGKPYVIWMQLGIVNEEAASIASKAGLVVVMDKCIMVEHKNLR